MVLFVRRVAWLRRTVLLAPCLAMVLAVLAGPPVSTPRPPASPSRVAATASRAPDYAPGEVLIKFRAGSKASERGALRSEIGATSRGLFRSGAEHWRLPPGLGTDEAIARLRSHPHVDHVEPNYILAVDLLPDDPRYTEQYHLRNTGFSGGTAGADIDAGRAWNLTTGSREVIVAIIDSGVDAAHPDLAPNIYVNPGEIPGNGVDDDANGYIDDAGGWDFANKDNDPFDDNGHGTHVAGIVGAVGNNRRGVSGVCWRVTLLPVKFLAADGTGFSADAIRAIDYAALMGAQVMNNSWGGGGFSPIMQEAIDAAGAAGALFVAAAGNQSANIEVQPHYPASYVRPNVVAVAATDASDVLAPFSNYGASSVLLGAPGVGILSTFPRGAYGLLSGTSMAAPVVSGAAALLRARDPEMSVSEMVQRLRDGADPVQELATKTISGGRLNAFRMMAEEDTTPPGRIDDLSVEEVSSSSVTLRWTATGDDGDAGRASTYEVHVTGDFLVALGAGVTVMFPNRLVPGPAGTQETLEVTGFENASTYSFALRALDEWEQPGPSSNTVEATTLGRPALASSPAAIEAALRTGQAAAATLIVGNAGSGTLDWRVAGADGGATNPDDLPLPAWLSAAPAGGRVAAGERQEVTVAIDAAGLSGGLYEAMLILITNDPARPYVPHPVRMAVTDAPAIEVQPRQIDFGAVHVGVSATRPIIVWNRGTVDLSVSRVESEDASLVLDPQGFLLAPGNARTLDVIYAPVLPAVLRTSVVILSDAANEDAAPVTITSTALLPPVMEVTPAALEMTLPSGDDATAHLLLTNRGGSALVAAFEADAGAGPRWLMVSPAEAVVPPDGALEVAVSLDAAGLEAATYEGEVRIASNVPGSPGRAVPVRLTVAGAPHLEVEVPEVLLESRRDFSHEGESTRHVLAAPVRPAGGGTLELLADGDYGNPPEKATLVVEGQEFGAASRSAGECGRVTREFQVGPETLAALLADGVLDAEVRNTAAVGPQCDASRHTVRLRYAAAVDAIDFGEMLAGTTRTRSVLLRNTGNLDLHVVSIAADLPGLTMSESSAVLAPGAAVTVGLRLDAGPAGSPAGSPLEGGLSIDSDDPTAARHTVGVSAKVLSPSALAVAPERIETVLLEGRREDRPLTLWNPGPEPVDLALSIAGGTTSAVPGPCSPATFFVAGFNTGVLETLDLASGARQTIATGFFGPSAVAVDPAGRFAFVTEFNGKLAAVDLGSRKVMRFAQGAGISFGIAYDAGGGTMYVSSFTAGAIFRVDPATGAHIQIASGLQGPRAIALDPAGRTAWVVEAARGALSRVDLQTGSITLVAAGLPDAAGLAVDRQGGRAYVSLGTLGSLVEVDLTTGSVTGLAAGLSGPSHLVLDESGTGLYVAESIGDRLSVLDLRTGDVRVFAAGLREPVGLALSSPSGCLSRFASVEPRAVRIPAGGTAGVTLSLDAAGLPEGGFDALLSIGPRQPFLALSEIPLSMTVVGRPRLRLVGQQVILESSQLYFTAGARTQHVLGAPTRPGTAGIVEVTLEGDYSSIQEKGRVRLEGSFVGEIGGAGVDCIPISAAFEIDAARLAAAAADGAIGFEVQNTSTVSAGCPVNRHQVRLVYRTADLAPGLDFGALDVGDERGIPLMAQNTGGRPLEVTGIAVSGPGFAVSAQEMSLAPGASQGLNVRFTPQAPGDAAGRLSLSSNDPDAPSYEVPLQAVGIAPPRLEWAPAVLEAVVPQGRRVSRTLTLFNRGGRPLTVTLTARPPAEANVTPTFATLPPEGSLAATVRFVADLLLPGTRSIEIVITSNDPALPEARVPASLLVQADTDRDGVPDASDLCPSVQDAEQSDRDADLVGDACDNCPDASNPAQEDANDDGGGDACQPVLVFAGVRQDGGQRLEVATRVFDPQRDPLGGTVDLRPDEAGLPGLTLQWAGALPRLTDISALSPGHRYTLILTVTDGTTLPVGVQAGFLHQEETILVLDMPPRPIMALPATVECDRPLAGGVRLDGSGSLDEDSNPGTADDIVSYEWLLIDAEGARRPLGPGSVLGTALPLGESRVVLRVTDAAGEAAETEAPLVVRDTAPPAMSLAALPAVLWPPDHRLVPVRLHWQAIDICDPAPDVRLVQSTSSEPDDAPGAGDGHTTDDVGAATIAAAEGLVMLRAERDGSGPGRIYTLTCEARDRAGNAASAPATTSVPRDVVGVP